MKKVKGVAWLLLFVLLLSVGTACAEGNPILYIGTEETGFGEYPLSLEGELTAEALISGIANLTGWRLTLAEPVTVGKGGMSICFTNDSALFVGPPDPQNPEFHMFDAAQLAQTILDSVKKTLQMNFTTELGNPDTIDIYYYAEGGVALVLDSIGKAWPIDQPYEWNGKTGAFGSAILYIGTQETGFEEYTYPLHEELAPDVLITAIEELTGWKMDLLEPVTMGKGGMSVGFGPESALFVGPYEPQNVGFEVFDSYQLAQTMLDSIQKTLQMNFTTELGDPDTLDIYYFMENDQPLTLEGIGKSWPIDAPYQWENG